METGGTSQYPCQKCGSIITFQPGSQSLMCHSCGHSTQLNVQKSSAQQEEEFELTLAELKKSKAAVLKEDGLRLSMLKCRSCGSETTLPKQQTSGRCPFCSTPSVLRDKIEADLIRPKYMLPFVIDQNVAISKSKEWIHSLWFAPTALKKINKLTPLQGVYIPYWTYDSNTTTQYIGQRGVYYYVNETYTLNGKTETRKVRHTRWSYTSGVVSKLFDDVLVAASQSVPQDLIDQLEPWDLGCLVEFNENFLLGFQAEKYQLELDSGFDVAKMKMDSTIQFLIRQDIGGDEQRINSFSTQYSAVKFKHILLPIWITTYVFNNKIFQVLINARTGEVHGRRPWSAVKIVFAILAVTLIIVAFVIFSDLDLRYQFVNILQIYKNFIF